MRRCTRCGTTDTEYWMGGVCSTICHEELALRREKELAVSGFDPFAYFPPPAVWSPVKPTEAKFCDCGGFKCKTTHANWCRWKAYADLEYKVSEALKKATELRMLKGK